MNIGTFKREGFSKEDISELIDNTTFGPTEEVVEIPDGVNVSAKVTTGHPKYQEAFIKIGTYNSNKLFTPEPFVLRHIHEYSDINVPLPLYYDYTKNEIQYPWHVSTYVKTVKDTGPSDFSEHEVRSIAHSLAKINSTPVPETGKAIVPEEKTPKKGTHPIDMDIEIFSGTPWPICFRNSLNQILTRISPKFTHLREPSKSFIEENYNHIQNIDNPRLLHFDFWWENIIESQNGPVVIDWQRSYGGRPAANLAIAEYLMFETSHNTQMRDIFRQSYFQHLDGDLSCNETEWVLYKLYGYLAETRGFPYWWRNASRNKRQEREKELKTDINKILNGEWDIFNTPCD